MRSGGRKLAPGGAGHFWDFGRILVTTQVALFIGTAFSEPWLFVRSFRNLVTTDPGFQAEGLLLREHRFHPKAKYSRRTEGPPSIVDPRRAGFSLAFGERVGVFPGFCLFTPIGGMSWNDHGGRR